MKKLYKLAKDDSAFKREIEAEFSHCPTTYEIKGRSLIHRCCSQRALKIIYMDKHPKKPEKRVRKRLSYCEGCGSMWNKIRRCTPLSFFLTQAKTK